MCHWLIDYCGIYGAINSDDDFYDLSSLGLTPLYFRDLSLSGISIHDQFYTFVKKFLSFFPLFIYFLLLLWDTYWLIRGRGVKSVSENTWWHWYFLLEQNVNVYIIQNVMFLWEQTLGTFRWYFSHRMSYNISEEICKFELTD